MIGGNVAAVAHTEVPLFLLPSVCSQYNIARLLRRADDICGRDDGQQGYMRQPVGAEKEQK